MKLILIGVVLVGLSYVGYGINRYYQKRKRYFEDSILLCERLSVDISFSKDNLLSIISKSMDNFSPIFRCALNGYAEFLKDNKKEVTADALFGRSTLLKDDEKDTIFLFFKNLGRLDASNQIDEINNFKQKFVAIKDSADHDNKKFGSLSVKLCLLLALLIVILII